MSMKYPVSVWKTSGDRYGLLLASWKRDKTRKTHKHKRITREIGAEPRTDLKLWRNLHRKHWLRSNHWQIYFFNCWLKSVPGFSGIFAQIRLLILNRRLLDSAYFPKSRNTQGRTEFLETVLSGYSAGKKTSRGHENLKNTAEIETCCVLATKGYC